MKLFIGGRCVRADGGYSGIIYVDRPESPTPVCK